MSALENLFQTRQEFQISIVLLGENNTETEALKLWFWAQDTSCGISLTGAPRIVIARVYHSQIMLWSHDSKHHNVECLCRLHIITLITYGVKLLNADWLRQRAFSLNHEGTFGNQEGMITCILGNPGAASRDDAIFSGEPLGLGTNTLPSISDNLPVARAKQLGRSIKKTASCKKATELPG